MRYRTKTYRGEPGGHVTINRKYPYRPQQRPLPLRLDVHNHSPTGFGWGYGGSGPAQLALALLCDHLRDNDQALDLYQAFEWRVIASLPAGEWTLTTADIDRALAEIRAERAASAEVSANEVPF